MRYLLLLALLLFMGCEEKESISPIEETYTVTYNDLLDKLTQTGEVHPLFKIKVKSEASGKIEKLLVRQGERVSKGQPLLEIDPSRLNFSRKQRVITVKRTKIELDRSKREYERAQKLHSSGNLSQREFYSSRDTYSLAKLAYEQARLDLSDITDQQKKTVLKSPIDGVITELTVAQGEIVVSATSSLQNGTTIATIADITNLEVISRIGEADYVRLKKGQKVEIHPEAVENSKTVGTIDFIALSANRVGAEELSSFEVRMRVDSLITGIAPGITVNVDFILMQRDSVLSVPYYYVKKGEGRERFVHINSGTEELPAFEERVVKVGETDYHFYEILSGLEEGEEILLMSENMELKSVSKRVGKKKKSKKGKK